MIISKFLKIKWIFSRANIVIIKHVVHGINVELKDKEINTKNEGKKKDNKFPK